MWSVLGTKGSSDGNENDQPTESLIRSHQENYENVIVAIQDDAQ